MREVKPIFNGPRKEGLHEVRFEQIKRSKRVALYRRSDGEYEIVTLIVRPPSKRTFPDGRSIDIPEREVYPSGENWGSSGYFKHTSSRERAEKFYKEALKWEEEHERSRQN